MESLEETIAQSLTENFNKSLSNNSYVKSLDVLEIMTCLRDIYRSLVYSNIAFLNIKKETNEEISEERVKEVIADIKNDGDAYLMVCHNTYEDTIAALYIRLVFFSIKWFRTTPSVGSADCDEYDTAKELDEITKQVMSMDNLSDVESILSKVKKLFNNCCKGTIDLDWFVQLRLKAYENNVIVFNG